MLRGKEQLSEYWHQRLGKIVEIQVRLENVDIHVIDAGHVWSSADEYISIGEDHQKAVVTNIFVQEDSRWKILLDHTTYVQ